MPGLGSRLLFENDSAFITASTSAILLGAAVAFAILLVLATPDVLFAENSRNVLVGPKLTDASQQAA